MIRFSSIRLALVLLLLTSACTHKPLATPPATPATLLNTENSYLDIAPGTRLTIVAPLLKKRSQKLLLESAQTEGRTVKIKASNLMGYQTSNYVANDGGEGKVHLRFVSAETTKNGQSAPEQIAPPLPFALPEKARFIRLVFLIRASQSDHNMAILAANTRAALDDITTQVMRDSTACRTSAELFCVWVPAEIAVRPESGN